MTERGRLLRRWYQGFANIPLRLVLTVPFVLQLVGAVGIVGYLSARSGQQSVRELADKLTQQVLFRIKDRLDAYLQMPHYLIKLNRAAIEAGELNIEDFDQLKKHFLRQVKTFPSITTLTFGNTRGEVIGAARDRAGVLTAPGALGIWDARGTPPLVRRFYPIDEQGNPRAVVNNTPNFDVRQTHWYKAVVARGKQTWSPISPPINLPIAVISAVTPVYQNHEFKGGLTSAFLLSDLSLFLRDIHFSPAGQSFIIERTGDVVATSTPEKPFIKNVDGKQLIRLHGVDSKDELTRATMKEMLKRWHNLNQIQSSQHFNLAVNHQRQFVQIAPYQDAYGLDWLIVAVIPESDFMAEIHANTQRTWLLCGLTLLVAMGTGMLSAHLIATPIRRLQLAAEAIAQGQLDYPVETSGVGEVALLTNAFQQMAHQIETSFRSLQASEQRFQALLSNVPVGISIEDATGNQILLNQVGETILGQGTIPNAPLEIYQAGTNQLYPVEQLPVIRALLGETTSVDDMEIEVKGQRVALEVHAIPFFDEAGNVLYAINAFQDITKRRQAEEILTHYSRELEHQIAERTKELLGSEERFRRAFEDAPIGMALVALEAQFIRVNRSLCEILGYTQDELLSKTLEEITHPDDLAINKDRIQTLLAGEIRTYQVQKRYLHQLGHVVWVVKNVLLVRNSLSEPMYFIAQIQDISDRLAIDQMKDEFISIVSHELRTPLTAIHGALGILESGIYRHNPEQVNHLIQIALKNSDRLVRLVNNILDLERLESRKIEMVMESCEVTDLILQGVEAVQPLADAAKIHLDWTPLPVCVWAAPDALVQTLINLLSNAIKFSPANSTVWVKAFVVEANLCPSVSVRDNITPLPYILFSVQDQGRGIRADKLVSIFGRFQQVDVQDCRQKGGSGLGLAICKSIIQQHQGQIWAESVLGAGSTFYFTLPLQSAECGL